MTHPIRSRQHGATLIIALIMLVIMTLLLVTTLNLSNTNLLSVGNFQHRSAALASANAAIEDRLSSSFNTASAANVSDFSIDIDNDATSDYTVTVTPTCIRAVLAGSTAPSSVTLPSLPSADWYTYWNVEAQVVETTASTGAAMVVNAGIRVKLSDAEKSVACP